MKYRMDLTQENFNDVTDQLVNSAPIVHFNLNAPDFEIDLSQAKSDLMTAIHKYKKTDPAIITPSFIKLADLCISYMTSIFNLYLENADNSEQINNNQALKLVLNKIDYRQQQKGMGAYISLHESLGWIVEELDVEVTEAWQNLKWGDKQKSEQYAKDLIEELMDVTVACIWGAASHIKSLRSGS